MSAHRAWSRLGWIRSGERAPEQLRTRLIASLRSVQITSVSDEGVEQLTVQTLTVDRPKS
jgi:hypothetical protein